MEIACTEMASAVAGAERQREERRVNEQDECTVTWDVLKLDVCKEEEVISGAFTGDVCFPTHQTEHVDEVCCHLCKVKFSQKNLLALRLKNAHPKSRMLCRTCTVHMGQNLTKDQNVDSNVIQNKTGLDDKMVEVVGRMNETEENSITDSTEDNKTISLDDHSYVSSPTCRSIRETQNNVVMYTSSENVLVYVNETDKASPKSSYTESVQRRTSVDDRTVCSGIHDHDYFSIQNLANHMLAHKTLRSPNNVINSINKDVDVCNSKAETTFSPKDPLCAQSDLDQIWKDELECMGLLDHTYFFRPSLSNHTVLSKQVPSLQLECNNKQIQEDIVGEYEVIIQGSDHDDSDTLSADDLAYISDDELESDTDSYTSCTDSNAGTLGKGCTSASCQKPDCENTNQKSPSPVHYKNPNPATNLNTDLRICSSCGLHKVRTEKSTERSTCTCTQSFPCSLCEIVSGTEDMLLNHQEEKHILPVYVCVSCLKQFPTRVTFKQHACSKSNESLTPSNSSNNAKELAVMILDVAPSSAAAAESSKQAPSSPSVCIIDIAQNKNPGTVLNSTSHSSPASPCTSTNQKLPVQVIATGSSSCAQKVLTGLVNGDQGQDKSPIFTVNQKQIGQVQVLRPLPSKMVTQTRSPSSPILLSSQCQGQKAHKIGQVQVLSQLQAKVATQPPSPSSTTQILSSQGRVKMPPTVTQKQFGQVKKIKVVTKPTASSTTTALQVLHSLRPKVATRTPSPFVHNTQILHSSKDNRQMTPISTVTHMESKHVQDLTPLRTPTSSAKLPTSPVLPQQHPSFGKHLPHPFQSLVSNSVSVPSKTGKLSKSNVPLLDICKSTPSTPISTSSQGPLKIVAIFMNQSRELALQKRMCQSWRSKAVFPCRQCGAVSRQFSLGVRHRYQHRGPRLHRCQCGRAFQQLMHLLRHQVQHAEATRYVCATCGQMFCGTQQLACHRPLFRITASNRKKQTNKKCRNTFQCYCGRSFMRPAALLWHMLKNPKDRKPRLKGFRIS